MDRTVEQRDIAKSVAIIKASLANVEKTKRKLWDELRFIQEMCEHEREEVNPMNKWPHFQCKTCGKRW